MAVAKLITRTEGVGFAEVAGCAVTSAAGEAAGVGAVSAASLTSLAR